MNRTLITIADRFTVEAKAWLQGKSQFEVSTDTSPEALATTEGLIIRSGFALNQERLAAMPKLRAVVTATAGFDHIDMDACTARGIKLAHCPDSHSAAAAELTWALVLACARNLKKADAMARSGDWRRGDLVGIELQGLTYGIMGLGRIGSRVAKVAQAFGMTVVAFDPYKEPSWFAERGVERVGLDELFQLGNVISLHVPKTPETIHRIHRIHLSRLGPQSILVNTSRGGVIKESDLLEHLRAGCPGHFGLDVFANEPLSKASGLLDFPNLVLTPHIGANTETAFKAVSFEAARNLVALLSDKAATGPLPPNEEWFQTVSRLD